MKTSVKKLPKSQIELKIEVSAEEFNQFIEKAAAELGKDLEIKGFRKGKVPKEIIEKEVGSEKILIEAADLTVEENYKKAILENKIEAILQPKIEIRKLAKGDSFIFLAKTAVLPEIKLPDYKKIASKIKRKKNIVEEKEITEALKWLQKSRAKFTLKNQAAEIGDFVEIEYCRSTPLSEPRPSRAGSLKPKEADYHETWKDAFILGEGHFLPGFEEKLIGMRAGPASAPDGATAGKEEKEFSLTIPEKHPLRKYGREITLKVKMNSVQDVELPEIGDQLAKSLGKFENLAELKKNIKEGLNLEKERAESQRVKNEILEEINQASEYEVPEVLITREQEQMLENLKRNVPDSFKIPFVDYLKKIKKTEKEILDSFLPEARKKVKNFLVLREIGKREKIEVSENEIKEEVNKILKNYQNIETAQKNLDSEKLKDYTKEAIKNEKIFQLLEQFTTK